MYLDLCLVLILSLIFELICNFFHLFYQQPDSVTQVSDLDILPVMGSPDEFPSYVQTSDNLKNSPKDEYMGTHRDSATELDKYPLLYRKIKPNILVSEHTGF